MNKKGNFLIILTFFTIIAVLLGLGLLLAFGGAVVDLFFDELLPEIEGIGMVGESTNITEYSGYSLSVVDNFVQSLTWLTGLLYVILLIGSMAFALISRAAPNRWLIGFYFFMTLLMVIGSIFISNIYEDFYDDDGEIGVRLKEQALLSYMILYSPMIFTIIMFVTGIILFSGLQQEEFV